MALAVGGIIKSFTAGMELPNHIPCGIIKSFTVGMELSNHIPWDIIKSFTVWGIIKLFTVENYQIHLPWNIKRHKRMLAPAKEKQSKTAKIEDTSPAALRLAPEKAALHSPWL